MKLISMAKYELTFSGEDPMEESMSNATFRGILHIIGESGADLSGLGYSQFKTRSREPLKLKIRTSLRNLKQITKEIRDKWPYFAIRYQRI